MKSDFSFTRARCTGYWPLLLWVSCCIAGPANNLAESAWHTKDILEAALRRSTHRFTTKMLAKCKSWPADMYIYLTCKHAQTIFQSLGRRPNHFCLIALLLLFYTALLLSCDVFFRNEDIVDAANLYGLASAPSLTAIALSPRHHPQASQLP